MTGAVFGRPRQDVPECRVHSRAARDEDTHTFPPRARLREPRPGGKEPPGQSPLSVGACVEAGLPVIRGKAISETPSTHRGGVARSTGGRTFIRPSGIPPRAIRVCWSPQVVLWDYRHLWDGHDSGPNAVEPVSRLNFRMRP